jgi:hypothetical protein
MASVASVLAPDCTITGTTSPCCQWHITASGDTCPLIVDEYGVTLATIEAWNPSLGIICALPAIGNAICVDGDGRPSSVNPIAAPGPTLQGTVANCCAWYIEASRDTCSAIETNKNEA